MTTATKGEMERADTNIAVPHSTQDAVNAVFNTVSDAPVTEPIRC
jgi:hypothetical protein